MLNCVPLHKGASAGQRKLIEPKLTGHSFYDLPQPWRHWERQNVHFLRQLIGAGTRNSKQQTTRQPFLLVSPSSWRFRLCTVCCISRRLLFGRADGRQLRRPRRGVLHFRLRNVAVLHVVGVDATSDCKGPLRHDRCSRLDPVSWLGEHEKITSFRLHTFTWAKIVPCRQHRGNAWSLFTTCSISIAHCALTFLGRVGWS